MRSASPGNAHLTVGPLITGVRKTDFLPRSDCSFGKDAKQRLFEVGVVNVDTIDEGIGIAAVILRAIIQLCSVTLHRKETLRGIA